MIFSSDRLIVSKIQLSHNKKLLHFQRTSLPGRSWSTSGHLLYNILEICLKIAHIPKTWLQVILEFRNYSKRPENEVINWACDQEPARLYEMRWDEILLSEITHLISSHPIWPPLDEITVGKYICFNLE